MHADLLRALGRGPGLTVIAGPTGHGKTTAARRALLDPACPAGVRFVGDVRDEWQARETVAFAERQTVLAILRIPRAAGVFDRFVAMGVAETAVATVLRVAFSVRLFRWPRCLRASTLLVHEELHVTDAIRVLIAAHASERSLHRQALLDGMRSLRQMARAEVEAGRLDAGGIDDHVPDD